MGSAEGPYSAPAPGSGVGVRWWWVVGGWWVLSGGGWWAVVVVGGSMCSVCNVFTDR